LPELNDGFGGGGAVDVPKGFDEFSRYPMSPEGRDIIGGVHKVVTMRGLCESRRDAELPENYQIISPLNLQTSLKPQFSVEAKSRFNSPTIAD
jgi:hypothetical protein